MPSFSLNIDIFKLLYFEANNVLKSFFKAGFHIIVSCLRGHLPTIWKHAYDYIETSPKFRQSHLKKIEEKNSELC